VALTVTGEGALVRALPPHCGEAHMQVRIIGQDWVTAGGDTRAPGTVLDVSHEEAALLIRLGKAEAVIETAAVESPETAAMPEPRRRPRRGE